LDLQKKIALVLLLCLAAVLFVVGCGTGAKDSKNGQQTAADQSWEKIKSQGYFTVGLDDAFPPMGFREEGTNKIVGFDIDLAREAAKRMGVEVKFQPVVWDTAFETLNIGDIDAIWNGCTITPERQAQAAFTKPYIGDRQIIVVQKGSAIKTKKDLAGKTIGLQAGSSAKDAVQKDEATFKSFGKLLEFSTNDEALLDLKAGRLDAVVVDEVVGRYYIAKKPDTYVVLAEHFGEEDFGVAVRKEDQAFLAKLNEAIDEMKADGTAARISKQWFGEDIIKK